MLDGAVVLARMSHLQIQHLALCWKGWYQVFHTQDPSECNGALALGCRFHHCGLPDLEHIHSLASLVVQPHSWLHCTTEQSPLETKKKEERKWEKNSQSQGSHAYKDDAQGTWSSLRWV